MGGSKYEEDPDRSDNIFNDVDYSRAILPVGISENPKDNHFNDQEEIWLNLQMRSASLKNKHFNYNSGVKSTLLSEDLHKLFPRLINRQFCIYINKCAKLTLSALHNNSC